MFGIIFSAVVVCFVTVVDYSNEALIDSVIPHAFGPSYTKVRDFPKSEPYELKEKKTKATYFSMIIDGQPVVCGIVQTDQELTHKDTEKAVFYSNNLEITAYKARCGSDRQYYWYFQDGDEYVFADTVKSLSYYADNKDLLIEQFEEYEDSFKDVLPANVELLQAGKFRRSRLCQQPRGTTELYALDSDDNLVLIILYDQMDHYSGEGDRNILDLRSFFPMAKIERYEDKDKSGLIVTLSQKSYKKLVSDMVELSKEDAETEK
jgi:hypothetical protein